MPGSGVSWEGVPRAGPKLGNSRQSRRIICEQLRVINMKCGVMHNTEEVNSVPTVQGRKEYKNHNEVIFHSGSLTSLHGELRRRQEELQNCLCSVFIRKLPSLHKNKSVASQLP